MFITNSLYNPRIHSNDYKKQKRPMGIVILIVVMVITFYLGRYALREGLKVEDNNILKNIREMEQRDIMDKRKEIIYERNPDTNEIRSRKLGDYENTTEKMKHSYDDGVCEGEYEHDAIRGED